METADALAVSPDRVAQILDKREVKSYIDQVYLDQGYRNRSKLAGLLDRVIDAKVEEAEETELYSEKDLADLIKLAHQMRMDEAKLQKESAPRVQVNQQNNIAESNPFGEGNYGELIRKLVQCPTE